MLGDDYILYPAGWHTLRPLGVAKWGTPVGFYKRQEGGDALGCALDSASCPTWEVRYKASGNTEPVYWLGEELVVHALYRQVLTTAMAREGDATLRLAAEQGCDTLVRFALKSDQSGDLLRLLDAHVKVVRQAERLPGRRIAPVELGLPLAVGEPITRGQGEYTSTYPPVVCGHPREMTADYVESLLAPPELLEQAARDWSAVLSWARAYAGLDRMQDAPAPAADLSPPAESVAEDDAYGGWEKLK